MTHGKNVGHCKRMVKLRQPVQNMFFFYSLYFKLPALYIKPCGSATSAGLCFLQRRIRAPQTLEHAYDVRPSYAHHQHIVSALREESCSLTHLAVCCCLWGAVPTEGTVYTKDEPVTFCILLNKCARMLLVKGEGGICQRIYKGQRRKRDF